MTASVPHVATEDRGDGRFLSQADCVALIKRANGYAVGGGGTELSIESSWTGNIRWARNAVLSSGDVRENDVWLTRIVRGARSSVVLNVVDDAAIHAAVRRAERFMAFQTEHYEITNRKLPDEPYAHPDIWSAPTYDLNAERLAESMQRLSRAAVSAGMLSAGYENAIFNTISAGMSRNTVSQAQGIARTVRRVMTTCHSPR